MCTQWSSSISPEVKLNRNYLLGWVGLSVQFDRSEAILENPPLIYRENAGGCHEAEHGARHDDPVRGRVRPLRRGGVTCGGCRAEERGGGEQVLLEQPG